MRFATNIPFERQMPALSINQSLNGMAPEPNPEGDWSSREVVVNLLACRYQRLLHDIRRINSRLQLRLDPHLHHAANIVPVRGKQVIDSMGPLLCSRLKELVSRLRFLHGVLEPPGSGSVIGSLMGREFLQNRRSLLLYPTKSLFFNSFCIFGRLPNAFAKQFSTGGKLCRGPRNRRIPSSMRPCHGLNVLLLSWRRRGVACILSALPFLNPSMDARAMRPPRW